MMGHSIAGVGQLLERVDVPVHVQAPEVEFVTKVTGVADELVAHASGDLVTVGLDRHRTDPHARSHAGKSVFPRSATRLVSGDTLFLDGCGRTDLPGGNPEELYRSLTDRLAKVPDQAILYPGHQYSHEPSKSMGATRRENIVYKPGSIEQWLMMFGH